MLTADLNRAPSIRDGIDAIVMAFGAHAVFKDGSESAPGWEIRMKGRRAICALFDIHESTINRWMERKNLPAGYWHDLAKAAQERGVEGITCESLAWLHARSRWS